MSVCEAEIHAMALCIAQMLWIQNLMRFLKIQVGDVRVKCDNIGAVRLFLGQANPQRLKHIDIRYLFTRSILRDHVNWKLEYVPTEENIADIFTKPLEKKRFQKLRGLLRLEDKAVTPASDGEQSSNDENEQKPKSA